MIKYIIFSLFLFFCSFSNAEDSLLTLKQQLDRLQREVNDLSKSVFTSKRDNYEQQEITDDSTNAIDLTAFDLRIYDLEKDIKKLNNSFEELIFQIDDLNQLYKELNIDLSTLSLKIENSIKKNNLYEKSQENNTLSNSEIKEENTLGSLVINSKDLSESESTSSNQNIKNSEDESLSRMTIVTQGSDAIIEQITKQLNKLIDVVRLVDLTEGRHIERELMLIKVIAEREEREEVKRLTDIFRGRIIDVTNSTYTIELTGPVGKIDAFIEALHEAEVVEAVRSGVSGISRGDRALR